MTGYVRRSGFLEREFMAAASGSPALSTSLNFDSAPGPQARMGDDTTTAMDKLLPGQTFLPPAVNTGAMMRDANRVVPDLPQVQQDLTAARTDIQQVRADFEHSFEGAQKGAFAAMLQAASNQNLSTDAVVKTFAADGSPTKLSALATVATDMLTGGGGSFATFMMQSVSSYNEIRNEGKKLTPSEQEALMDETHRILNGENAQRMTFFASNEQPIKTPFHWDNLTPSELGDFIMANAEDQPEMRALNNTLAELDEVEQNLAVVEAREFDGAGNKVQVALAAGRIEDAVTMSSDEMLYQIENTLPEIVGAVVEASVEVDQETKDVLATLHYEPDMNKLLPDLNPTNGYAA